MRLCVRAGDFQKFGLLIFSDFWHDVRSLLVLKSDWARFLRKKSYSAKNGEIGVKNSLFSPF